jgi:hypothetical protein
MLPWLFIAVIGVRQTDNTKTHFKGIQAVRIEFFVYIKKLQIFDVLY